jgi:hypothetical protein
VTSFVNRITSLENQEGLARWNVPVCPRVDGLPREEGEDVLGRITQIAQEAGVPLAGESCRPNLIIFMTAGTNKFLTGLTRSDSTLLFGSSRQMAVDEFMARPGPVKVWYHTGPTTDFGLNFGPLPESIHPTLAHPNVENANSSRLISNVVYQTTAAFVFVDQTQLHGVTRGQFADYVSMVGLAQIMPGQPPGDSQTILALFAGEAANAPTGMTDWDRAFLNALYSTEQRLKAQRKAIVRSMVDKIVPP